MERSSSSVCSTIEKRSLKSKTPCRSSAVGRPERGNAAWRGEDTICGRVASAVEFQRPPHAFLAVGIAGRAWRRVWRGIKSRGGGQPSGENSRRQGEGLLLSSLACCSRVGSYLTGESLPRRWGGLSRLVTDPPARVLRVLLEGSTRCVVLDQRPDVHQIDSTR